MKVIDILLDIANGEDVPEKIKVYNDIYEYDSSNKLYWNKQHKNLFELYNGYFLTYEVEIIEDTPKKIDRVSLLDVNTDYILKDILNEIIDKINGGEHNE